LNIKGREKEWCLLEAQAQLHIVGKEHEKALNCYLQIKPVDNLDTDGSSNANSNNCNSVMESAYRHVFQLIERESMYEVVRDKITQLVHLSKVYNV
jgi:hypothetical protein